MRRERSAPGKISIKQRADRAFIGNPADRLAEAGTEATILMAEVDMARSEHVRRIWPFLRDRRIDAYGDLLKRYRD